MGQGSGDGWFGVLLRRPFSGCLLAAAPQGGCPQALGDDWPETLVTWLLTSGLSKGQLTIWWLDLSGATIPRERKYRKWLARRELVFLKPNLESDHLSRCRILFTRRRHHSKTRTDTGCEQPKAGSPRATLEAAHPTPKSNPQRQERQCRD